MRMLTLGWRSARQTPLAVLPLSLEAVIAGVLVATGAFPRSGAAAPAAAVFPLDVFFDVKQAIAYAPSWSTFFAAMLVTIGVRSLVLASTLWLADGRRASLVVPWMPALRWTALGAALFAIPALLMFNGVAIRYAPFVWVAGVAGFAAALWVARNALRLDAGDGRTRGANTPGFGGFLMYAVLLSGLAALIAVAGRESPAWAGAVVALSGPVNAMILLAWRRRLRDGGKGDEGGAIALVVVVLVGGLLAAALFDRFGRDPDPRAGNDRGKLLLLGGADSSSKTGSLTEIEPRTLGFDPEDTTLLSYRGAGSPYNAADTRGPLDEVAQRVAQDVTEAARTAEGTTLFLLGHSQAALILDRMPREARDRLSAVAIISPPPPVPPPVNVPRSEGSGFVGATMSRWLASALDLVGIPTYDIDAPAAPARLERVVPSRSDTPRLAVWALSDSVWLDRSHRRPGETNVVAFSDHVGAIKNPRTYDAVTRFFDRRRIAKDDLGNVAVGLIRYLFEPWRPS